jgi:LPPG:FO 2-phospho-L-lactate transferase
MSGMRITALSGGVGGARFLAGLVHHLAERPGDDGPHELVVVGNTADDITLHGLRVCPDLDTVMYTLGGGVHPEQGWGRAGETMGVAAELAAYGAGPDWFTLGDKDLATHLVRSQMLGLGYPLSQVTAALCARWDLAGRGVRLLPMTDDPVETHVVVDDEEAEGGQRAIHFQEWWVRHHAALPARRIVAVGAEQSAPAPGVLEALREADVVLVPPSNPVVSIGTILAVPGVRDALRGTRAPVVGLSPIVGGKPVRGMADACLAAIGVPSTARAVGGLFADLLDAWLVDTSDADLDGTTVPGGRARVHARPLLMTDLATSAAMAGAALDVGLDLVAAGRGA